MHDPFTFIAMRILCLYVLLYFSRQCVLWLCRCHVQWMEVLHVAERPYNKKKTHKYQHSNRLYAICYTCKLANECKRTERIESALRDELIHIFNIYMSMTWHQFFLFIYIILRFITSYHSLSSSQSMYRNNCMRYDTASATNRTDWRLHIRWSRRNCFTNNFLFMQFQHSIHTRILSNVNILVSDEVTNIFFKMHSTSLHSLNGNIFFSLLFKFQFFFSFWFKIKKYKRNGVLSSWTN